MISREGEMDLLVHYPDRMVPGMYKSGDIHAFLHTHQRLCDDAGIDKKKARIGGEYPLNVVYQPYK